MKKSKGKIADKSSQSNLCSFGLILSLLVFIELCFSQCTDPFAYGAWRPLPLKCFQDSTYNSDTIHLSTTQVDINVILDWN
jgi:hypothetical protein